MSVATELLQGHSPESLASLTGASESTARRWLQGATVQPAAARLLRILVDRDLGDIAGAWRGWRLSRDGVLVSPEQWTYTPGEVRSLTLAQREFREHQEREARVRAIKAPPPPPPPGSQLDWLQGRWLAPRLADDEPPATPYKGVFVAYESALRRNPDPYWRPWQRSSRSP